MSPRPVRWLALLSLLSACEDPDTGIKVHNNDPEASIDSPVEGAQVLEGAPLVMTGVVSDVQDDPGDLRASWLVDGASVCADLAPSADGVVSCETTLSADAVVVLKVTDSLGATGEDSVSVTVLGNEAPTIQISAPAEELAYYATLPVGFEVQVADDLDDPADLRVGWQLDGAVFPVADDTPDSDGTLLGTLGSLDEGTHVLKATVTDTGGKTASDSVTLTVYGENTAPTCGFDLPVDGACAVQGEAVLFEGIARDGETAPDRLVVSLQSDLDGLLDDAIAPTSTGTWTRSFDGLSAGAHTITLTVVDGFGDRCVEDVRVSVVDTVWYRDQDGDGHGDADDAVVSCEEPSGYVDSSDDCDDDDAFTHPGVARYESATACMTDVDGDGYGAALVVAGAVAGTDCNDSDAAISPAATEVCDSADTDEDCSGTADDSDPGVDPSTYTGWYADTDSDSYGDAAASTSSCDVPSGYVADDTDCDDTDAAIHPAGSEVCDGEDNDCDGDVDDDDASLDASTTADWFQDADSDGYGDAAVSTASCDAPSGYVSDDSDCDDTDGAVSPGATEVCDAADVDEDCSGAADDSDPGVDPSTTTAWYADSDGDGQGDAGASTASCDAPSGYVSNNSDCDDTDATVALGATEVCDGQDNDCDGLVDDDDSDLDTSTASTWYEDADGDGFGDVSATALTCDAPSGYVADDTDCDDTFAYTYPGATELCDGVANDCDDTAWVDDAGIVSFEDGAGAWSDSTAVWSAGISSLPAAISLASDGTAHVCEGTWYVALDVSANVSVVGEDGADLVRLSGGGSQTVVMVETAGITVGLDQLTLTDGAATTVLTGGTELAGGGVHCDAAAALELIDVVVDANEAGIGGGLATLDCDVLAEGVEWSDNVATSEGSAAWASGVTWLESGGYYGGNSAPQGGLLLSDSDATLDDVWFQLNESTVGGGAGLFLTAASTLDGDDVVVHTNSTGSTGSGSTHAGGALWIEDGSSADLFGSALNYNDSDNVAGGAYVSDATLTCDECTVFGNTAVGNGGGVYLTDNAVFELIWTTTVNRSHVRQCTSDASGGAVYVGTGATLDIQDGDLRSNTAAADGGGVYVNGGALSVSGGWIDGNSAGEEGGGVYVKGGGSVVLDTAQVETNDAASDGGGFYLEGGCSLEDTDSTFDENTAGGSGGAIFIDDALTLVGSTFTANEAVSQGGAVHVSTSGSLDATLATFDGNLATGTGADAGAVHLRSDATFDTCTFVGNSAADDGGALYVQNGASVDVLDSEFDANVSGSGGGAILNDSSTVSVEGSLFTSNTAVWGGAVYDYGSTGSLSVDDSVLTDNAASLGGGAGMNGSGGVLRFTNSDISSNAATAAAGDGGAFAIGTGGVLTLDTCTLDDNTAGDHGGAIATSGTGTTVNLTDADLSGNIAGSYGGGISASYYIGYPTVTVTRGSITSNVASTGGGIYASGYITATSVNMGATNSPSDTQVGADSDNWGTSASFTCTPSSCN